MLDIVIHYSYVWNLSQVGLYGVRYIQCSCRLLSREMMSCALFTSNIIVLQ
jgi:hypothetical protein